jgi:phosphate transport system protein
MSHYQERLEKDLAKIRGEVGDVGRKVGKAVHDAVHAFLTRNRTLANETALGDHPINRQVRRLDGACHAFVARHLPGAGHLRFISSVLRLNVELERVGDYAVNIARQTTLVKGEISAAVARDVELLASQAEGVLEQALESFLDANAELARGTKGMSDQVDATFAKVWRDLVEAGRNGAHPLADLFAFLAVFERLSRVGDQAKNICEETIFAATGETKKPKVYDVLFVDEQDDCLTQMAVAYARKAFPGSGRYASAGFAPAAGIDPRCAAFLDAHGYTVEGLAPALWDETPEELAAHHVIVSFAGDVAGRVEIPFHTILLEWPDAGEALLDEKHREIAHRVRLLVETLRGEEAD